MAAYSNPYPGEKLDLDLIITEDEVQKEFYEEIPAKYEEFRGMVREYLTWKKLFGDGEFLESSPENEELIRNKYDDKQVWSLFRFDECRVALGFYDGQPSVEGWYISTRLAEKNYSDILFELQVDCPVCFATGELDDSECQECEGEGNIWFRVDY